MQRKGENDYWWILLLLGLGAFAATRSRVRFLDPDTGAAIELPDASARVAAYAAQVNMTVPQLLDLLQQEADAAGIPLHELMRRRGLV